MELTGLAQNADGVFLFISNISRNVRCEHLKEIFESYGLVTKVEIEVDKRNGMSKGCAVLHFAHNQEAENAMMHMNGGQIDGKIVIVSDTRAESTSVPQRVEKMRDSQVSKRAPIARGDNVDGLKLLPAATKRARSRSPKPHAQHNAKVSADSTNNGGVAKKRIRDAAQQSMRSRSPAREAVGRARNENQRRSNSRREDRRPVPVSRAQGGSGDQSRGAAGRAGADPSRGRARERSRDQGSRRSPPSRYGPAPSYGPPPSRGRQSGPVGAYGRPKQPYVPIDRSARTRSPGPRRSSSRDRRAFSRDRAGGRARSRSRSRTRSRSPGRFASTSRSRSPGVSRRRRRDSMSSSSSSSYSRSPGARRRYGRGSRSSRSGSSSSSSGKFRRRQRRYSSSRSRSSSNASRTRSRNHSPSASRSRSGTPSRV